MVKFLFVYIALYLLNIVLYLLNIALYLLNVVLYLLNVALYLLNIALYLLNVVLYLPNVVLYPLNVVLYLLNVVLYLLNIILYFYERNKYNNNFLLKWVFFVKKLFLHPPMYVYALILVIVLGRDQSPFEGCRGMFVLFIRVRHSLCYLFKNSYS